MQHNCASAVSVWQRSISCFMPPFGISISLTASLAAQKAKSIRRARSKQTHN